MSTKPATTPKEETAAVEDISSPAVLGFYESASIIVNKVIKEVMAKCVDGANILEICNFGDAMIEAEVKLIYTKRKGLERGVAFPTSISVNNCVGHFSPALGDTRTLKNADVVKIDLGVHFDGYMSLGAHTIIIGANQATPVTGKVADAVCAAHYALEAAMRMVKPGQKPSQVTEVITKICESYDVQAVQGILSHDLKRYLLDGEKVIFNKVPAGQHMKDAAFEEYEVYCLDVVISTAQGKVRELNDRCTIYRRDQNQNYNLKLKSSRDFIQEVNQRFPALPFTTRSFADQNKVKLALSECVEHQLLSTFPILYEREGETVVQFKTTILVLPSGNTKLTCTDLPLPFVSSVHSIQDESVKEVLARTLKNPKVKKAAAVAAPTPMEM
eukprot:gene7618-8912_t